MKKTGVTMTGLYLAFMVVSVILSFISGKDITSGRYIIGSLLCSYIIMGVWNGILQIDIKYF